MSGVLLAREPDARYLVTRQTPLLEHFDVLATAPGGVAKLRELILTLAVQGKLVPQDAGDEPAGVLLERIGAEKARLVAEGKIKPDKSADETAGAEEPFDLPAGWHWVRMGRLVNASQAGWSPSCIASPRRPGRWGVLKVSAVSWGDFDADANKELPPDLVPRPEYEVKDGDFLLSRANTEELVARSVVVSKAAPMLMLSDKIIRLDVSSQVNRLFLNLCNNASHARSHYATNASGTSSSMKNVSREVVLSLPIPLPPLAEQSRIVASVEELMRLCDALEARGRLEAAQHAQLVSTLLGALTDCRTPEELAAQWQRVATHFDLLLDRPEAVDALEQTILQLAVRGLLVPQDATDEPASVLLQRIRVEKDQLIAAGKIKRDTPLPPVLEEERPFALPQGWEWTRLDSMCRVITDGDHLPPPVSPAGVAFLTIGNISSGRLNFDGCRLVPQEYFDAIAEYRRPAKGDVLYTVVGASYGRPVIVDTDRPFCVQRHIGILKPALQVNLDYLVALLLSRLIYGQATRSLTGTAQPTVGLRLLRNFVAPLPPLAEQSRIVARVESLRRLCADLRQRLTAARSTQSQLAEALVAHLVLE